MIVQNNYIHDICSNGVYAKGGATDVVIKNNIVERTNGAGIAIGFDTSPQYFDLTVCLCPHSLGIFSFNYTSVI